MQMSRVDLSALFNFEVKRVLDWRVLVLLAVLLLFMGYLVNTNVSRYKNVLKNTAELREVEAKMFKNIRNYTHYSFHGIRVFTVPAAASIFFHRQGGGLTARVNSVASLDIYKDYKGKFMPGLHRGSPLSFAFLVLVAGTLLPLFMGYEGMMYRGYLKFLCSAAQSWKVVLTITAARMFILYTYIIICYSWMAVLVALRQVVMTAADFTCLSGHLVSAMLMITGFLLAGMIIGTFDLKKFAPPAIIAAVWFTFVYVIPWAVGSIIDNFSANIPSSAQIILKKMDLVKKFEDESKKKYGTFDRNNIVIEKRIIEDYWKHDYNKLEQIEKDLIIDIEELDKKINTISILINTTFYNLTSAEVGSAGYRDYIHRLLYLVELQGKFVRFYIDRCFYHDPDWLVPFVTGNENVFQSSSYLPRQFAAGAAVQMLTILLLLAAVLYRFSNLVYGCGRLQEKNDVTVKKVFKIRKGEFRVFIVKRAAVVRQLFNHLSGKAGGEEKPGTGIPFEIDAAEPGFTFLCHPDEFPDTRVRDFQDFMANFFRFPGTVRDKLSRIIEEKGMGKKYFRQLKNIDKGDVLLRCLCRVNSPVFLADDIGRGLPAEFNFRFNEIFKAAAASGAAVVYLSSNILIMDRGFEADEDVEEFEEWSKMVDSIESVERREKSEEK